MRGPPVVLTPTLGRPVTNVISERGAVPMTVVNTLGEPVTLVASGGEPVTLFNANGTLWDFPFSLFSNNEQGAWYDPSDFSTLFQDSAGTTPVTAVEQPVRLMLDRSRGLVLGSPLALGTWTQIVGAGTITGSGADVVFAAALDNNYATPAAVLVTGAGYEITVNVLAISAGSVRLRIGTGQTLGTQNSTGSVTYVVSATATDFRLVAVGTTTTTATVSVSIKELPGNHALAPNDASRPVLRSRYNQLTFSEQFDDAVWGKSAAGAASIPVVTANAGVAPDGTTTADRVVIALNGGTATGDFSSLPQTVTATSGVVYTFTIYLKSNTASSYAMLILGVTGTQFPITVTPTWQRFEVVQTSAAASVSPQIRLRGGQTPTNSDSVDILAWGAQLLTAADQTATGGAYQRVGAATDYDTSNPVWRPYLAFDGTDDSFGTSAIDFSGTDEMTVFAGVTKLSDVATGLVAELSASVTANNGSFYLAAPGSSGVDSIAFVPKGTTTAQATATGIAAPSTSVVTGLSDISTPVSTIRINGAQSAQNTSTQGTGNFGNHALFIGARNNASFRFNGRIYGLTVLGRTATEAELSAMEAWVNGKTGAY